MTTPFLKDATVRKRILRVQRSKKDLQTVYDREMRRLDAEKADIQARCPHTEITYHGDPSGGSDGYYECTTCRYNSKWYFEADEQRAREIVQRNSTPRAPARSIQ